jgi:putative FmdB family regulatory protein
MPIYEYKCRQCGNQFEQLVLRSTITVACPACQQQDLEQLISLSSVSSDGSRQANLSAAHRKAASVRSDKARQSHADLHEHFEDRRGSTNAGKAGEEA